jgi:hypothetical protein
MRLDLIDQGEDRSERFPSCLPSLFLVLSIPPISSPKSCQCSSRSPFPTLATPNNHLDNECAIGLATSSVRPKKPKSIDMRLDLIKERTGQNVFRPVFLPCSWSYQSRQFRHIAALPFLHDTPLSTSTPTPFPPHTSPHHTTSSQPFQSPRCSPRQGPTYLSLPLNSTHFVLPIPVPMSACMHNASTSYKPSLTPVLSPHHTLKQGTQHTCQPRTHCQMLVFKLFRVLHYPCLCLLSCLT